MYFSSFFIRLLAARLERRSHRIFKINLILITQSKMKLSSSLIVILGAVALASCEVFFEEKFLDGE
jgi:hypothetical protein